MLLFHLLADNMGRPRVSLEQRRLTSAKSSKKWRRRLKGLPPPDPPLLPVGAPAPAPPPLLDVQDAPAVNYSSDSNTSDGDFHSRHSTDDDTSGNDEEAGYADMAGEGDVLAQQREEVLEELSRIMSKLHHKGLSHDGCQEVYDFILRKSGDVARVQAEGQQLPTSVKTLRRRYQDKMLPKVYTTPYTWVAQGVERQEKTTEVRRRLFRHFKQILV